MLRCLFIPGGHPLMGSVPWSNPPPHGGLIPCTGMQPPTTWLLMPPPHCTVQSMMPPPHGGLLPCTVLPPPPYGSWHPLPSVLVPCLGLPPPTTWFMMPPPLGRCYRVTVCHPLPCSAWCPLFPVFCYHVQFFAAPYHSWHPPVPCGPIFLWIHQLGLIPDWMLFTWGMSHTGDGGPRGGKGGLSTLYWLVPPWPANREFQWLSTGCWSWGLSCGVRRFIVLNLSHQGTLQTHHCLLKQPGGCMVMKIVLGWQP